MKKQIKEKARKAAPKPVRHSNVFKWWNRQRREWVYVNKDEVLEDYHRKGRHALGVDRHTNAYRVPPSKIPLKAEWCDYGD